MKKELSGQKILGDTLYSAEKQIAENREIKKVGRNMCKAKPKPKLVWLTYQPSAYTHR